MKRVLKTFLNPDLISGFGSSIFLESSFSGRWNIVYELLAKVVDHLCFSFGILFVFYSWPQHLVFLNIVIKFMKGKVRMLDLARPSNKNSTLLTPPQLLAINC